MLVSRDATTLSFIGVAGWLLVASAAFIAACGGDGPPRLVSPTSTSTASGAALATVTVAEATVVGGTTTRGGVTLTAAAPQGGAVVTLASENDAVTLPASVAVPQGSRSATFPIGTSLMPSEAEVRITGTLGTVSQSAMVRLLPGDAPVTLASFVVDPNYFIGGFPTTGFVTLTGPAPVSGLVIGISSSGVDGRVPDSMTIETGATSGRFAIGTGGVSNDGELRITITAGSATLSAMMRLLPNAPPPAPTPTPVVSVTPGSQTFAYTGGAQAFVVPAGVTQVTVDARAGKGGGVGGGGLGGRVEAVIPVVAGETLTVTVGGAGGNSGAGAGGFNGGAGSSGDGGGGGGASSVSRGITLLAVAGGGGGAGRPGAPTGGSGGGLTGGTGTAGGGGAGLGGTQVAGGAGGAAAGIGTAGAAGGSGSGGLGGSNGGIFGGGGGGGGYFGGGGGGSGSPGNGSGGGGGSSYTVPGASAVVHTQGTNNGAGQVTISW